MNAGKIHSLLLVVDVHMGRNLNALIGQALKGYDRISGQRRAIKAEHDLYTAIGLLAGSRLTTITKAISRDNMRFFICFLLV